MLRSQAILRALHTRTSSMMQLLPTWRNCDPCVTLARRSGLRISPFREWRLDSDSLTGRAQALCYDCSIFGIGG